MNTDKEIHDDCLWNLWDLPRPEPFITKTSINQKVKHRISKIRETLFQFQKTVANLDCLNVEALTLSRLLYRNFIPLKKDKGYQLLKMIMTSLHKFLKMNVVESVTQLKESFPLRFSPFANAVDLPTQISVCWILAKFQGMAALFYRIYHLTKRAGLFLYQRLRLMWSPAVLVLGLGLTARIHAISKYLVLQCVQWHSSLVPQVKCLNNPGFNPYQEFPQDLKAWLGGLEDLVKEPVKEASTLDLVFQLIDLTREEDEDFVQIFKEFADGAEDDEVRRVYEMVPLDSPRKEPLFVVPKKENDSTVILSDCESDVCDLRTDTIDSEDIGELVTPENAEISEIVLDDDFGESYSTTPSTSKKSLKRKQMDGLRRDNICSVYIDTSATPSNLTKKELKALTYSKNKNSSPKVTKKNLKMHGRQKKLVDTINNSETKKKKKSPFKKIKNLANASKKKKKRKEAMI